MSETAMTLFPLYAADAFGYEAFLVLGTLIGVAFGFVLERSGFGRAPVLAAQFYGSDTRVLKVMFTGIVTALVGMTVLDGAGLLDISRLVIPETILWAQVAGGLLLGVGFIVSGYCPGTSVVSAASGNVDGLVTVVGVVAGSLVFGVAWPVFQPLHDAGAMGVVRLPDLLGVPQALLAFGVFAMAVGAFGFGEWVERALGSRRGEPVPASQPRVRNRVLAGLGGASAIGLALLLVPGDGPGGAPGDAPPGAAPRHVASIEPLALAADLVERPWSLSLVDVRPAAECEAARIPGAACLPADDPAGFLAALPPARTLVLYAAADLPPPPDVGSRFTGPVAVLRGGFDAFRSAVLAKPELPAAPDAAAVAAFRTRSALHGHFTGAKTQAPPAAVPARSGAPAPGGKKKGGGC